MKKIILLTVAVFVMTVGLAVDKSSALNLNFTQNEPILNQYQDKGIYFRDSFNMSGNSPALAVSGALIPNDYNSGLYIMFTQAIRSGQFRTYEFWEQQPAQNDVVKVVEQLKQASDDGQPTEPPPPDENCVYVESFWKGVSLGSIHVTTIGQWSTIPFGNYGTPIDAVHIYDSDKFFILDNLSVEFDTTPVPEPSAMLLLGAGLAGLGLISRRRKNL